MQRWEMTHLQREATTKRATLDGLNAALGNLETMLGEAQEFEGAYSERLADVERRISLVARGYALASPSVVQEGDPVEYERLVGERNAIERQRDAAMARVTTERSQGPNTLRFCALRSDDIIRRRQQVVAARDEVARELADIDARLSPGEIVQTGQPADEYLAIRQRIAEGRARSTDPLPAS